MPFRASRLLRVFCLLAVSVGGMSTAYADEPAPSLYERRLGIIKGTSKGFVLLDLDKSEPPAAATSTERKAESSHAGTPLAAAPKAPDTSSFLAKLPPASGRSMADARRLGAPGGGIPVPTTHSASPSEAEPAKKP